MTDAQRGEEIAARVAELRAVAEDRRKRLAILALAELGAHALIASPGPVLVDGEVVRDEDGAPVLDAETQRTAERLLGQARRARAELLG